MKNLDNKVAVSPSVPLNCSACVDQQRTAKIRAFTLKCPRCRCALSFSGNAIKEPVLECCYCHLTFAIDFEPETMDEILERLSDEDDD